MKPIQTAILALSLMMLAALHNAAAQRYLGEDPDLMLQLKELDIMGINLEMTMSKIVSTLQAQGLEPDCSRGIACLVRTSDITMNIEHTKKSLGNRNNTPMDPTVTPVSIGFSQVGPDQSHCNVVRQAVEMYCAHSVNKQPCWTDNFGRTQGNFSGSARSADGYRYSGSLSLQEGKICAISVKRLK